MQIRLDALKFRIPLVSTQSKFPVLPLKSPITSLPFTDYSSVDHTLPLIGEILNIHTCLNPRHRSLITFYRSPLPDHPFTTDLSQRMSLEEDSAAFKTTQYYLQVNQPFNSPKATLIENLNIVINKIDPFRL